MRKGRGRLPMFMGEYNHSVFAKGRLYGLPFIGKGTLRIKRIKYKQQLKMP